MKKNALTKFNTHLWFKKRAPRKLDTDRNYLNLIKSIYKNPAAIMIKVKVLVAQLCLSLNDTMDCSPPGFSLHGILQARIPEWVVIPFSRESSQPRDRTWVSCIVRRFFTIWAIKEATRQLLWYSITKNWVLSLYDQNKARMSALHTLFITVMAVLADSVKQKKEI